MNTLDIIINKYFNKSNIKHAYLLETEDFNSVLTIAKKIIVDSNEKEENIEYLIDNDMYSDLKIIRPDGQWIKKEQIANLKQDFNVKSSYNSKRIYIVKNAENLNKAAANTMLKFLEEPEKDIVALLVTNNKSKVLETIVSRCQYIFVGANKYNNVEKDINSVKVFEILENKQQKACLEIVKMIDEYEDRNEIRKLFNDVIFIYEQFLFKMLEIDNKCKEYNDLFDKFAKNNKIESIRQKMEALAFAIDSLEYNLNLKLLMDKLVISMFGVE